MYGWLTFYHHGHEVAKDYKPHMTELQTRIQKVSHFDKQKAVEKINVIDLVIVTLFSNFQFNFRLGKTLMLVVQIFKH